MARPKVLPFIVAAAVAMIIITDVSIVRLLTGGALSGLALFYSVWPLLLTSTTAIILVMSSLYHALQAVLEELAAREERARTAGFRDPLTGLGNRQLLAERLQQSVADLNRYGRRFALLMLDLDRFKDVNDIHGHPTGDELLLAVASRLGDLVRETDTLIRFGGDEFMVLQNNLERPEDVAYLSRRIREATQRPFQIDGIELSVGVSVGAVLAEAPAEAPAEYVRKADIALYEAKRGGRNRAEFYSSKLDLRLQRRAEIERELAADLETGSIDVHYQPQISTAGEIIAAEALVRWTSRNYGVVPATELVKIAEDCGLIRPLSEQVFSLACAAARQWQNVPVAVNFCASQIHCADLPGTLASICSQHGLPCDLVELELTESVFEFNEEQCEAFLSALRGFGFRVALDDFGAGYSSLRYLQRFKLDKVKLDKGFSDGADTSQSIALIRASVMLAHSLGLTVVAEGIETAQQEELAIQGGCDGFQGFRFGPPMTAQQFTQFLERGAASAA